MPYNDARSDVFSNPPELRNFESLPPQVVQRLHTIRFAVENIASLENAYSDSPVSSVPLVENPIIEQIQQSVDITSVRTNLESVYTEAA